eukprot:3243729-Amphidinium_carterae.1
MARRPTRSQERATLPKAKPRNFGELPLHSPRTLPAALRHIHRAIGLILGHNYFEGLAQKAPRNTVAKDSENATSRDQAQTMPQEGP